MRAPCCTRHVFLLLAASGCGLPLADRGGLLENTCESAEDCGPNATCSESICVSTTAELPGVFFQIEIPAGSPFGAGTTSLIPYGDIVHGGPFANQNIQTSELVTFTQSLSVSEFSHPRLLSCGQLAQEGASIPIAVDLAPIPYAVGIPTTVYSGESDLGSDDHSVALLIPKGDYRVYVRPVYDDPQTAQKEDALAGCEIPPVLFTSLTTAADSMLEQPASIRGTLLTGGMDLAGWTIDLVEKLSGRVISTSHKIDAAGDASFDLLFWNTIVERQSLDPIIRLTPHPEASAQGMPVIFWHLSSVGLLGYENIELDLQQLAGVQPVQITGTTYDGETAVPATVVLQSNSLLEQSFGDNISHKQTIDTDANGVFIATVLPGNYQVTGLPSRPDLAITSEEWSIDSAYASSVRTLELNPKATLKGQVLTPQGAHAFAMPVFVQPSASPPLTYLQSQFNSSDFQPTSDTAQTVGDGRFELRVDPGAHDVFVRPPATSGLPWLVRSQLHIEPSSEAHEVDLGELYLGNPVVLSGHVVTPDDKPIGGATIRAWLPLTNADPDADELLPLAIQIGETSADGSGAFRLLLPPSISR